MGKGQCCLSIVLLPVQFPVQRATADPENLAAFRRLFEEEGPEIIEGAEAEEGDDESFNSNTARRSTSSPGAEYDESSSRDC